MMDFPSGKVKVTLAGDRVEEFDADHYRLVTISTGCFSEKPVAYEFTRWVKGFGEKLVISYPFMKVLKIESVGMARTSDEIAKLYY